MVRLGKCKRRREYTLVSWPDCPVVPKQESGSCLHNLPFDEWSSVFGSERLTGALLDRLTHHVHILEMNGESYRLRKSRKRRSNK